MRRKTVLLGLILMAVATPAQAQSASEAGAGAQALRREIARTNVGTSPVEETAARVALEKWASCLARKNAPEARRLLAMDFTSADYERGMRKLSQSDKECVGFRGTLKSAGLLFAGELAEALLENEGWPLVPRLTKAGTVAATPAFSFTDKVAICVVRSVPNDVAKLFATARGSAEETASLEALATPMAMCAKAAEARKPISVNPAGLRAMLATAAFRSVSSLKAA